MIPEDTNDYDTPEEALFRHEKMYVNPTQKYEDVRSSAFAFLLIGGGVTIFSVLCWLGFINLPMEGASGFLFRFVMTAMGLGCLAGALLSYRSAAGMKQQVGEEETLTKTLITWFLDTYRKEQIDETIRLGFPDISEDELTLKRFELIQDYLIVAHDLPNQAYLDALCEEIYQTLYE